jgi:hypothetical protein
MLNPPLPNIPWEERPAPCSDVVWRYSANPIIPRDLIPSSNSIFNSAVASFRGAFAGVFRCDNKKRQMNIHRGFSQDGIHWQLENGPIDWLFDDPEISSYQHRYDPRVVWLEDRYYVTWCNGYQGPTIGIGTPLILKISFSLKMPSCLSIAKACFFLAGSVGRISCSTAPAITGILPLAIFSSARVRT